MAAVLSGAWWHSTTAPQIFLAEFEALAPLLIQSGAGALAWWRISDCALATSDTGRQFHQLYRLHRLEASLHVRRINGVIEAA
jgi:hypothetical protein